jgi:RNA polymerase sigma factor (sigma-70 family)
MNKTNVEYADRELMAMLRSRAAQAERQATDYLYARHASTIGAQLRRNGCQLDDAADAFQYALESFWMALADADFEIKDSIGAWLLTVARRHWLNQLSRKQHLDKIADDIRNEMAQVHEVVDPAGLELILHNILGRLDATCRRLLELRFLEGLDRQSMAAELGYTNVESVSNRSNLCRDRAKQIAVDLGYRYF